MCVFKIRLISTLQDDVFSALIDKEMITNDLYSPARILGMWCLVLAA